ncbi:MAG: hypothetical protein ACRBM6_08745 [Geminicoccales bacterium]
MIINLVSAVTMGAFFGIVLLTVSDLPLSALYCTIAFVLGAIGETFRRWWVVT